VPLTDRADGIVAEVGRGGSDEGRPPAGDLHQNEDAHGVPEEVEQFGEKGKGTIERSFSDRPSLRPIQLAVGLHGCLFLGLDGWPCTRIREWSQ
jgi:hypothetical protein